LLGINSVAPESHFQLLGLPARFALDEQALQEAWLQAAAHVHPDRYASASAAEKRVAMQWASRINEAYRVLRAPLERARYLCQQAGCALRDEDETRMDGAFLMRQMHWREQLEQAESEQDTDALLALDAEVQADRQALVARVGQL